MRLVLLLLLTPKLLIASEAIVFNGISYQAKKVQKINGVYYIETLNPSQKLCPCTKRPRTSRRGQRFRSLEYLKFYSSKKSKSSIEIKEDRKPASTPRRGPIDVNSLPSVNQEKPVGIKEDQDRPMDYQ
jgi:hypothetical protein